MPGCVFWFCAEWRRARRVLQVDQLEPEVKSEVISVAGGGEVPKESCLARYHGLAGWQLDAENAREITGSYSPGDDAQGHPLAKADPGGAFLSTTSPTTSPRRQSGQTRASLRGVTRKMLQGAKVAFAFDRTSTVRPVMLQCLPPGMQLLFLQPKHPLAGLREECTREEFVQELRSRMSAERLFRTNTGSKAPSVQPTLSVAEAEDLFDALAILQNVGSSGPAGVLRLGKAFDVSVDKFFSLVRFRQLMDRTASCPNDFFQRLDLDKSQSLSLSEIARFIQNPRNSEERQDPSGTDAGASGADPSKLAELVFSALDANRDGKIESWEFQQQLALAAPPRLSLVALTAHLEMKHGFGQSGLHGPVDRALLFEYLCNREALDLAPEDVARCLRVARSSSAAGKRGPPAQDADLEGTDVDAFLRILPVDAVWGLDPYIDQYYAALGTRVLMLERPRRGDACVPREALLEHREKAPDEAELRARFGQLWDAAALMGSAKEIKDAGIGRVHEEIREGCFKRYAAAAAAVMEWRAARMQEAGGRFLARHFAGPRSLFFNIGDVLATPSHRLYAGQACVVRFRLHGGASFWHPQHQVLKNEREPTAWPLQQQALGDTPFVGLVPRGLKFTTAGGGGFYLGKQPFSMVDPNLRADLPRDEASGALAHSGCVEITMPSLLRTDRREGATQGLSGEFELRLFCASKSRIVGSIGEPLPVCVVHQIRPPPLQSAQAQCEGTTATVRWSTLDLGPSGPRTTVDAVRLSRTGGGAPLVLLLEPDATEREFTDLLPDTEYEFRVRLENCAGPGREASVLCRTNGFCSEPTQLGSLPAGTTFVDLQWNRPKTLGNEATRDTNEAISHYEATLKVEDDDADHHDDEGGLPERVCRWAQGSWREDKAGKVVVRLSALRPDTKYMLRNLCAVNSMGKGSLAKPLGFWTIPQSSRMSSIRVKQGVVLITLAQPLPSSIQKCSVSASSTSSPETAQTLEVEPPWTPGELALPFDAMPFVESGSSHSFRLQTRNAGGWSEWSPPLETEGIARQQGADRAQTLLETAMGSRKIDQLESALAEVSDIELPEETIRENALTLLQTLKDTKTDLAVALEERDPISLRAVLATAREVKLPELGRAQMLLRKLDSAMHRVNNARGIDALRGALKAAHDVRLPGRLLQGAVERLGTREACQYGLEEAMSAARVPALLAALKSCEGMHLPLEAAAREQLASLQQSEGMLRAAIQSRVISELLVGLEAVAQSGLREQELTDTASELLRTLQASQDAARVWLGEATQSCHPNELRAAIDAAHEAQVPDEEQVEAIQLLARLNGLVTRMAAAEGIQERSSSLSEAVAARLPEELLRAPRERLEVLRALHGAMAGGNPELLRRGLRSAEEHGLRDSELIEGQVLLDEWGVALRDMDVAMALRRTGDLHAAVTRARSIALCDLLLGPFDAALRQLEQGASAERKLHRAMAACKCESLLKALAAACDAEVTDLRLISEARALWERLTSLRAGLAEAVESTDLQTLAVAMYNARSPAALPSREVARADAMLQELREVEQSLIYGQLDGTDDFRTLDAQLGRVKRLKAAGVELDKHALTTASRKSAALQDLDRKKLEIELLDQRTSNTFPKWIEEVPVPHRAQMIPSAVVFGEVDVSFEPRSTTTYVLPREIVECLVTVRSEEEEKEKEEAGAEVAERGLPGVICGEVISLLRSAISGKDEVLHWPAEPVPDVSRDDAVETHVGIYVGALHTAADIVAALVGSQEGALDPDDLGRHAVPWLSWDDMPLEAERSTPRVGPEGGLPLLRHGRKLGDYLTQVRGRVLRRVDLEVSWAAPSPMTARRGSGPGSGPGSGQKLGLACIAFDGESLVEIVDSQGVHGEHYGVRRPLLAKGGCYPDGTLGSVQHGSGEPGGTDGAGRQKQAMQLRIDLVPQRIVDLVFVATAGHGLKSYGALRADVVDADRSRVMASCDVKGAGLNEEVAVVCCLHRGDHDVWTFHSCGGFSRGRVHEPSRDPQGAQPTAFDYQAVLGKLVEMGYPRNEAMRLKVPAVLEGMQRELLLDREVKPASVTLVPTSSRVRLRYAIELFGEGSAGGEEMVERLAEATFHADLEASLRGADGSRLGDVTVEVFPAVVRPLSSLRFEMRWRARGEKKVPRRLQGSLQSGLSLHRSHNPSFENYRMKGVFMDGTCICFEGQALREVVDYRGPHGVRLVSNGVLDYRGLWSGPVKFGDATAGAVNHVGETLEEATSSGMHAFQVSLDALPSNISDLYMVFSEPTCGDVSQFEEVNLVILNGDDTGHEIVSMIIEARECSEAIVAARLCRGEDGSEAGHWRLDHFDYHVQGDARNYRPTLLCLRAIQETKHAETPPWPHLAVAATPGADRALPTPRRAHNGALGLPRLGSAQVDSVSALSSVSKEDREQTARSKKQSRQSRGGSFSAPRKRSSIGAHTA